MRCDIAVHVKKVDEDLWYGACEETGFVVNEVCEAFRIFICVGFLDDGTFDKITKFECAYGFLVYAYIFIYLKLFLVGHI